MGRLGEGLRGEKTDRLSDGWLEEATVRGIGASMGWEDLSDTEECGKESDRW